MENKKDMYCVSRIKYLTNENLEEEVIGVLGLCQVYKIKHPNYVEIVRQDAEIIRIPESQLISSIQIDNNKEKLDEELFNHLLEFAENKRRIDNPEKHKEIINKYDLELLEIDAKINKIRLELSEEAM